MAQGEVRAVVKGVGEFNMANSLGAVRGEVGEFELELRIGKGVNKTEGLRQEAVSSELGDFSRGRRESGGRDG